MMQKRCKLNNRTRPQAAKPEKLEVSFAELMLHQLEENDLPMQDPVLQKDTRAVLRSVGKRDKCRQAWIFSRNRTPPSINW